MIKVLYGDEPYLIEKEKKQLIAGITMPDFNLAEFYSWENCGSYLVTYPVMEDKKIALLYINDIKELDGKEKGSFSEYTQSPSEFCDLYIFPQKVDKRSSIYKLLKSQGAIEEVNKVTDKNRLQEILIAEITAAGGKITKEAYQEFLMRESYLETDEINLFNLVADIQALVSYSETITLDNVKLLIKNRIVSNVFGIAKLILENKSTELKRQAEVLSDSTIETLSALLREYRIAWKCKFFPQSEVGAKYIAMKDVEKDTLYSGMEILMSSIDGIKNGSLLERNALWYSFQKLLALHAGRI